MAGGGSKLERDQERGERPCVAMEIARRVWGLHAGPPCAVQIIQHTESTKYHARQCGP